MKTIHDVEFENKKVLIRCDYNVPLKDGIVTEEEDDRIEYSISTVREILEKKAKFVLLVSHLGRPEGQINEEFSLKPVRNRLQEYLGYLGVQVTLVKNLEELASAKENGNRVVLLENIRFWSEEESSDEGFAKKIMDGIDVYVNNAFPVSHRDHSSITKFPQYASEKCAGNLFVKEIENLDKVKGDPKEPAVAIIGGAKIETKLPVIETLAKNYEFVLVGGKTANEALDQELNFPENVILPVDFSPQEKASERLDIGEKTQALFIDKIKEAQTIVWNGPLGFFEKEEASMGTRNIIAAITRNHKAFKLVGGGETIAALNYFSNSKNFNYVSMSGGAMLDYLAGKELPGIKALS
jgi:phosphoglycerate kinase